MSDSLIKKTLCIIYLIFGLSYTHAAIIDDGGSIYHHTTAPYYGVMFDSYQESMRSPFAITYEIDGLSLDELAEHTNDINYTFHFQAWNVDLYVIYSNGEWSLMQQAGRTWDTVSCSSQSWNEDASFVFQRDVTDSSGTNGDIITFSMLSSDGNSLITLASATWNKPILERRDECPIQFSITGTENEVKLWRGIVTASDIATTPAVPEPTTATLALLALAGLAARRRRK